MKENLLNVLMDLFQDGMDDDALIEPDWASIHSEWLTASFPSPQIQQALAWLDRLADRLPALPPVAATCRIYAAPELEKLNVACRGFLLALEQSGVLDPESREQVINQVMTLEPGEIGLDHLKLMILMTLFNQLEPEDAGAWLEKWAFDEEPNARLH
jgi:Smg protein